MTQARQPFFADLYANFWRDASPDLKAALAAGCEMEYISKTSERGITLTVRTKHPVAIVRQPNGEIDVYEKKPSENPST